MSLICQLTSEDIKHQLIIIIIIIIVGPLQSFSVMIDIVADAADGEDGDINGGADDNKEMMLMGILMVALMITKKEK